MVPMGNFIPRGLLRLNISSACCDGEGQMAASNSLLSLDLKDHSSCGFSQKSVKKLDSLRSLSHPARCSRFLRFA